MPLEPFQRHGEHVFLNKDSAGVIMQKALDHLEYEHRADARKLAFDDCTEYWKSEMLKIAISDYNDEEKWLSVMKIFKI